MSRNINPRGVKSKKELEAKLNSLNEAENLVEDEEVLVEENVDKVESTETKNVKIKTSTKRIVTSILSSLAAGVIVGVPAVIYYNNRELEISIESHMDNFVAYKLEVKAGTKIGTLKSKLNVFDGHTLMGIFKDSKYKNEYKDSEKLKKDSKVYLKYEKWTYSVTLPENNKYYEIYHTNHEDLAAIHWGETFTFTLKIKEEWTESLDKNKINVTANGQPMNIFGIYGNEIVYSYDHIDVDLNIEIKVDSYEISLPTSESDKYVIEYDSNLDLNNFQHGDKFEFKFKLGEKYKIKEGELPDVKLFYSISEQIELNPVSYSDGVYIYEIESVTNNVAITFNEKQIVVKTFIVDFSSDENYNTAYRVDYDKNLVEWGETFKFKVSIDEAWKTSGLKVFANSEEIFVDEDGFYSIIDIKSDVQIKVENIERKVFEASFASTSVYQIFAVDENKNEIETPKLYWNETLNIKVVIAAGYDIGLSEISLMGDALLDESGMSVIKNSDGSHTIYCKILNIKENISIEVSHPSINEYYVAYPQNSTGYSIDVIQGETIHGSIYKFKVSIDEAYNKSDNVLVSVVSVMSGQLIDLQQEGDEFYFKVEEDVVIRVENVEINKYSVIIPSSKYYTIERDIMGKVDHGTENFKFKLVFNDGYDRNYGIEIIEKDGLVDVVYDQDTGWYVVQGLITDDVEFIIDDVVINTYSVTFPTEKIGYQIITDDNSIPSTLKYGETLSFKIDIQDGYSQSAGNLFVSKNGDEFTPDANGYYTIESISENVDISIEGLEINKYTITWVDDNGDLLLEKIVTHGLMPSYDIENPVKANTYSHTYEFMGWDNDIASATTDVTYTAVYKQTERTKYTLQNIVYDNIIVKSLSRGDNPVQLFASDYIYQEESLEITYSETEGYVMSEFTVNGNEVYENETYSLTVEGELDIEYFEVESYGLTFKLSLLKDGYLVGKYNVDHSLEVGSLDIIVPSKVYNLKVYAIEAEAFKNNEYLSSITLPNSISSIGSAAFHNCSNLSNVVIEDGGKSKDIRSYAFLNCIGLNSIKIPASVNMIYGEAFKGCLNLTEVVIDSERVCAQLISDINYGNLIDYATTVRINKLVGNESDLYNSVSYRFSRNSTLQDGYYVYTQKETSLLTTNSENINVNVVRNGNDVSLFDGDVVYSGEKCDISYTNPEGYEMSEFTVNGIPYLTKTFILIFKNDIDVQYKSFSTAFSYLSLGQDDDGQECYEITGYDNSLGETDIEIPNKIQNGVVVSISNNAFENCSMTGVKLPNSLETIGDNAFKSCSNLTSIEIPINCTTIGDSAFEGCASLESVTFPTIFKGSEGSYGIEIFKGCSSLESVSLPKRLTQIPQGMFKNCSNLSNVIFDSSTTSIGNEAFYSCSSLSGINLPDTITTIGMSAFANSGLTEIIIPAGIQSVGSLAFAYCAKLATAEFTSTTSTIISSLGTQLFRGCSSLTGVTLPSTLTTISNNMFNGCTSLTTIDISGLTEIGDSAFSGCTLLKNITWGYYLQTIGKEAFYNCSSLGNVHIGSNVQTIGAGAFTGCSSLESVYVASAEIFKSLTSRRSCGNLIAQATTISVERSVYENYNNTYLKNFPATAISIDCVDIVIGRPPISPL